MVFVWTVVVLGCAQMAFAQLDFEKPPIDYGKQPARDPVAKLAEAIDAGTVELKFESEHGWLKSVLDHLKIPIESQVLVFSKTSVQLHKISPSSPRALYFNDDVYVGWCQNGEVVEFAATDANQGAIFYTLEQDGQQPPKILRDQGQCLTCHATNRTQGVPGYLVRSVFSDASGRPRGGTRTYVTDHTSRFDERWGGWYVSGHHGGMRHMGNVRAENRTEPEALDREAGANRSKLEGLFDTQPYLNSHSDLVALMVLEHQTQMHNLIARASFEARTAEYFDRGINEALGRPLETVSESTERRIASVSDALVRYMLFADEVPLTDPISGTSDFGGKFSNLGIRDSKGRSLRDLDLKTRMLKHPCSYLIYSQAFDALPPTVMNCVRKKVGDVLFSGSSDDDFKRISPTDRQAILEILLETKPGFLLQPPEVVRKAL